MDSSFGEAGEIYSILTYALDQINHQWGHTVQGQQAPGTQPSATCRGVGQPHPAAPPGSHQDLAEIQSQFHPFVSVPQVNVPQPREGSRPGKLTIPNPAEARGHQDRERNDKEDPAAPHLSLSASTLQSAIPWHLPGAGRTQALRLEGWDFLSARNFCQLLLTCSHQQCTESFLCFRENTQLLMGYCVWSAQVTSLCHMHRGDFTRARVNWGLLGFCPSQPPSWFSAPSEP